MSVTDFNYIINAGQIREYAVSMANIYSRDLKPGEFADEMIQFIDFAKARGCLTPSSLAMLTAHRGPPFHLFQNINFNTHVHVNYGVQLFR